MCVLYSYYCLSVALLKMWQFTYAKYLLFRRAIEKNDAAEAAQRYAKAIEVYEVNF